MEGDRAAMSGGTISTCKGAGGGGGFWRGRLTEDEEFDEGANEDYDRKLT